MARFWKEEDSRTMSTFVPLPLDFLREKIEGVQKNYDTAKLAAADAAKYSSINYIEDMDKDKAIAERVNKEKLEYAQNALDALDPNKMSRLNPMTSINEAVQNILQARNIEARITTPGTEEYQVNANYLKMVDQFKEIDKYSHMSEEDKQGRKNRLLEEYRVEQHGRQGGLKSFGDFSAPAAYDYQTKLEDIMSKTTIDKTSGHKDIIGTEFITARDWSSETRTPSRLAMVAFSYIKGDKNLQDRLTSEIKDRAYFLYNNQEDRDAFIRRETLALKNGGFNANALNEFNIKAQALLDKNDIEGYKKLHATTDFSSMVDTGTYIGSLVSGNIDAFRVHNTGGGYSYKQNYLWDADNNRKRGTSYVVPNQGEAVNANVEYKEFANNISNVISKYDPKNPNNLKDENGKPTEEYNQWRESAINTAGMFKNMIANKGINLNTFIDKIKAENKEAGLNMANSMGISQDEAILLSLASGNTEELYTTTKYKTREDAYKEGKKLNWFERTFGIITVNEYKDDYKSSIGNVSNAIEDFRQEIKSKSATSDVSVSMPGLDIIALDPKSSLHVYNNMLTDLSEQGLLKLRNSNGDYVSYNDVTANGLNFALVDGKLKLKGSMTNKDKSVTSDYYDLGNNVNIIAGKLGSDMIIKSDDTPMGTRTAELGYVLVGSALAGDSFKNNNLRTLPKGEVGHIEDANGNMLYVESLKSDRGIATEYRIMSKGEDGQFYYITDPYATGDDKRIVAKSEEELFAVFGKKYGDDLIQTYRQE